jgi:hypothetical protein
LEIEKGKWILIYFNYYIANLELALQLKVLLLIENKAKMLTSKYHKVFNLYRSICVKSDGKVTYNSKAIKTSE